MIPVIASAHPKESVQIDAKECTMRPYALYGAINAMSIWLPANSETIDSTNTP
jgi:hypothetical protein